MINKNLISIRTILATAVVGISLVGCSEVGPDTAVEVSTTQQQPLGQAQVPYQPTVFSPNHEITPTFAERKMMHIANRLRVSPIAFSLKDNDLPATPKKFMYYDPQMVQSESWFGRYTGTYDCTCFAVDPASLPDRTPAEREAKKEAEKNAKIFKDDPSITRLTCHKMKVINNVLRPYDINQPYTCFQNKDTDHVDERKPSVRNDYFQRGIVSPGTFAFTDFARKDTGGPKLPTSVADMSHSELQMAFLWGNLEYIALYGGNAFGFLIDSIPTYLEDKETNCYYPETYCRLAGGECQPVDGTEECDSTSLHCPGVCKGGGTLNGSVCYLPLASQSVCNKLNTDEVYPYFSFVKGTAVRDTPEPVLRDGVALAFGRGSDEAKRVFNGQNDKVPFKHGPVFGTTPAGNVEFAVNYYDTQGESKGVYVVIDNDKVQKLTPWAKQNPPANYTDASQYFGVVYQTEVNFTNDAGCHKYYFVAEDASGMLHTFPEYGSLGFYANSNGDIDNAKTTNFRDVGLVGNDQCNSYYNERVTLTDAAKAKLPGADLKLCDNGQTRSCYTSDHGFIGRGACTAGTETCVDGKWEGVCKGEVLPAVHELCDDAGVDENCNGYVNEGCPVLKKKPVKPTQPTDPNQPGQPGQPGSGDQNPTTTETKKDGGCSSTGGSGSGPVALFILGALGLVGYRRRKE